MKIFTKLLGLAAKIATFWLLPSAKVKAVVNIIDMLAGYLVKTSKSPVDDNHLADIRRALRGEKSNLK